MHRDMVYNAAPLRRAGCVRAPRPSLWKNLLYYGRLAGPPAREHRIPEAAGPQQVISYQQQFERFMAVSGKRRYAVPVPSDPLVRFGF